MKYNNKIKILNTKEIDSILSEKIIEWVNSKSNGDIEKEKEISNFFSYVIINNPDRKEVPFANIIQKGKRFFVKPNENELYIKLIQIIQGYYLVRHILVEYKRDCILIDVSCKRLLGSGIPNKKFPLKLNLE